MNPYLFVAGLGFVGAVIDGAITGVDWKLLIIYWCLATVNFLFGAL